MTNHQRGIQTVELAGDILKLVCGSKRALSLSEIAETLEMSPGSAYKYLISLLRTGLLKRNDSTLEYEAGPLSLRLGLSKIKHDDMLAHARNTLTHLAEKYQLNAFASMWSDLNGATVVFYKEYGGFFNLGFRLGMRLSLLNTTTGRLFAAYMNATQLADYLDHDDIKQSDYINVLQEIRIQGYSTLSDIPTPGFTSYAVPVFDCDQNIVMTLTAFGSSERFVQGGIQTLLDELNQIAAELKGQNNG
ncbi:IclR family transcriptional regulator [Acinetobacter wanghuae]|uniref:IclR family transcriptional regulator n=1 Tax=Acinetobacter wanghuae TaxID=2662362 RepID=UPI003AF69B47